MSGVIGVLALQGAYQKHVDMLASINIEARLIRFPTELDVCDGLIIPGGESTTMSLLIQKYDLYPALRDFAASKPVMGVCAGAILMAKQADDTKIKLLDIMPINILRNYYGRQVNSFRASINLAYDPNGPSYPAHFIRAPLLQPRDQNIESLATYQDHHVMMKYQQHLAMSFHPELTGDTRVHRYWLEGFHPSFRQTH